MTLKQTLRWIIVTRAYRVAHRLSDLHSPFDPLCSHRRLAYANAAPYLLTCRPCAGARRFDALWTRADGTTYRTWGEL